MTASVLAPPAVPAAELASLYRQAAEVIKTGGLCKRHYSDGTGAHCTIGAVRKVNDGDSNQRYLEPLALRLGAEPQVCQCGCGTTFTDSFSAVTVWNDRDETTAEDVFELLTRTADELEAQS